MSSTTDLTLKSLHLLSPGLAADFDEQLTAAVLDCKQRPALGKARELTIKLTIIPHPEDADDVLIQPVTTRKTPARKIESVRARRSRRNQLQFDFSEDQL